jgi:2-oxoglutarate dehydrogenase E1 component
MWHGTARPRPQQHRAAGQPPQKRKPQANVGLPAGQGSPRRVSPPWRDLSTTPEMWGRLVARLRGGTPPRAHAAAARIFSTAPASASYVADMYAEWQRDPSSVDPAWATHFETAPAQTSPGGGAGDEVAMSTQAVQETMGLMSLVTGFQTRGHNMADLDPLGINDADIDVGNQSHLWGTGSSTPPELDITTYGYTEADLEREFELGDRIADVQKGYLSAGKYQLRDLVEQLRSTYCGTIGFEYMHLQKREQLNWIRERVEKFPMYNYDKEMQSTIMTGLMKAHNFEAFLQTKFANDKRFGLEGCESLIPAMLALIDRSAENGVEAVVVGMPHRGRLNVLANVLGKPLEAILKEFAGSKASDEGSGDVKYHLGTSTDYTAPSGNDVHISLVANPSHLEAVNPVVEGKTRALQRKSASARGESDERFSKALSLILHGDAAFAGQGVVYESFAFSQLPAYTTGGTVHIVVNNQIGFTTDPRFSRSTPYCSDIGRAFNAPIFHVNGDDPEAVAFVCMMAADWRHTFHEDVIVDLVCYRRHGKYPSTTHTRLGIIGCKMVIHHAYILPCAGHNEQDQPMFTQPKMYTHIAQHRPTVDIYTDKLVSSGKHSKEELDEMHKSIMAQYEAAFDNAPSYEEKAGEWLESRWAGFKKHHQEGVQEDTGVDAAILRQVGLGTATVPEGFTLHKALNRILKARAKTVETGTGIDFATAEAMAFGTLMLDRHHVRMSGQDVGRGTFSHRHAVLHDQKTEETYVPLQNLSPDQAQFTIENSHLSEYAVLGFELGYSMNSPQQLVLWEAQFGDFANTAQCIIDQFISSGEQKWLRQSGLVMLLPHGYEGMGPEHSSARLERFLQMSDDDQYVFPEITPGTGKQVQGTNWQVYTHILIALSTKLSRNITA